MALTSQDWGDIRICIQAKLAMIRLDITRHNITEEDKKILQEQYDHFMDLYDKTMKEESNPD